MSDSEDYFDDDFVLDEHDRAVLDAQERKYLEGQQQQQRLQRQQQQQQPAPPPTAEMTRTALRRPIESDASLPAAKKPKTVHGARSVAPTEMPIGVGGLRNRRPQSTLGQIQTVRAEPPIQNPCPSSSPGVAPSQSNATPSSSTIDRLGSVDGHSRQASVPSAAPRQPQPLPAREGIPERDLGAEINALRAEIQEVSLYDVGSASASPGPLGSNFLCQTVVVGPSSIVVHLMSAWYYA
ncbi:hypothetical protein C8Q76DRAFT_697518 [Earliella scabrosa]|nr:hypothetical protein C8Q76DRAFT_697518 [Earliella scabrosa]